MLKRCNRDNLCVDCDNEKCVHHGRIIADCPQYDCANEPLYDCEHCDFIKKWLREYRKAEE